MSRYIDADHAEFRLQCCGTYHGVIAFDTVKAVLNDAPSIDIEPKRGEWVNARDGVSDHVKCTNCFRTYYLGIVENYNFCPNCGAEMRKESE